MKKEPKIVLWDLETLPDVREVYKRIPGLGAWPGRTIKAELNSIISFGYKILGEKSAHCINVWDFDGYEDNINDDSTIVAIAYEILKDADLIVTHNGKRFDVKVLNTRLAKYGYPPLPKIAHADTNVIAKRALMLYSNSLNSVSSFLGCEAKMKHTGWDMWVAVGLDLDKPSMKMMSDYCIQDVEVLEQVYLKLRQYAKPSESVNFRMFDDSYLSACPGCGSNRLQKNGKRRVKKGFQQRHICLDCGTNHYVNMFGKETIKVEGL